MTDQNTIELKKNVNEKLLDANSRFTLNPREIADIVILDNHYKDEKSEFPDRVISSKMIVEDFGGVA